MILANQCFNLAYMSVHLCMRVYVFVIILYMCIRYMYTYACRFCIYSHLYTQKPEWMSDIPPVILYLIPL